jgi:hypothetical protein
MEVGRANMEGVSAQIRGNIIIIQLKKENVSKAFERQRYNKRSIREGSTITRKHRNFTTG